jgi:biopolymer transport protein ExbD
MAIPLGDNDDELYRPLAEINVTPLVDVMLVLLIIFMVTAPLLSAGVKINLPAAASARPLDNKALEIGVDRDGAYWLGPERVELDALADAVKAKLGGDMERPVRIRGDKDAAFGEVVAALDRLSRGGVQHIAIVALPQSGAKGATPP